MKALYFESKLHKVVALKLASLLHPDAAFSRISPLSFGDIPEPNRPNERWIKVRNRSCGLCGTDIHFMFMDLDPKVFPAAIPGIERKYLGHEVVSTVTEVGADAGPANVGDRVVMRIDWPSCHQLEIAPMCSSCARGDYMLCENVGKKELPIRNQGGGFSPYMVMHRSQYVVVPPDLGDDEALLVEPLACALHGVLKAKPRPGGRVLVIGAGAIGLLTVAALRALSPDAQVVCLARYPFQGDVAARWGAEVVTGGPDLFSRLAKITGARHITGHFNNEILLGGFDVVYDSVGGDESLSLAMRAAKSRGDVVLIGINFKPGRIDYTPVWNQEIRLTGINCHALEADGRTSFDWAMDLLRRKAFRAADLITHRFPLEDYEKAVKTFLDKKRSKALKIVIDHE